jgi:hypothetical protein
LIDGFLTTAPNAIVEPINVGDAADPDHRWDAPALE